MTNPPSKCSAYTNACDGFYHTYVGTGMHEHLVAWALEAPDEDQITKGGNLKAPSLPQVVCFVVDTVVGIMENPTNKVMATSQ